MITLRVRQTVASSAPMPNARPRRRGQAPQPRSGAPQAQGFTAAIAVAAPSKVPPVAQHPPNSIGATAPIGTSTTLPNYTSLTDVTEPVGDQVDWPHVVEEIEHSHVQRPDSQDEIARLRAQLAAAEALVKELRARLDELAGKLTDTQHELATAQDQVEAANVRAVAAGQAEHATRRAKGLLARLKDAWHGE
jgi:uncharacterized coiled-coil protein SlyX